MCLTTHASFLSKICSTNLVKCRSNLVDLRKLPWGKLNSVDNVRLF